MGTFKKYKENDKGDSKSIWKKHTHITLVKNTQFAENVKQNALANSWDGLVAGPVTLPAASHDTSGVQRRHGMSS